MKSLLTGLCSLAFVAVFSCVAQAAPHSSAATKAWVSMLVTGTITVSPDGSVHAYTLDKADKLPPVVVSVLGKSIPRWRFQPTSRDGKPVTATAMMSVRMVAEPLGDHRYSIRIGGSAFGSGASTDQISYKHQPRASYPVVAELQGATGTVYLLLRINRQGTVDRVAARQVDLTTRGSSDRMKAWRQLLAESATKAAAKWTFNLPTASTAAASPYWVASIAVNYQLQQRRGVRKPAYGDWVAYLPGPVEPVPWVDPEYLANGNIDALPPGVLLTSNGRLQRIAP